VLTVGDRVSGLFSGGDATPRVHIDRVGLETMPLRTYLLSKKNQDPSETDYTDKELAQRVVVVNLDARYARSSRQVSFPARLTLQARTGTEGRPLVAEGPLSVTYYLDAANDQCGCSEYFPLPRAGREYRAEVQILEPNTSHPMADRVSAWYPL
jgi:hypothetical protein